MSALHDLAARALRVLDAEAAHRLASRVAHDQDGFDEVRFGGERGGVRRNVGMASNDDFLRRRLGAQEESAEY